MKKSTKIKIIIAGIIAVLLIIVYVIVTANYKEPEVEEPIFIPSGSMSDSIFDYQNMERVHIEGVLSDYMYKNIPIDVEVPEGKTAFVEDTLFVPYGNNYVFTYDSKDEDVPDDLTDMLKSRVTPIINSHADEEKTVINSLSEEWGYINGCIGACFNYEIYVDGEKNPYYATVFELEAYDYYVGNEDVIIVVGCMGMGKDASYMQERYDVATMVVKTFNFNTKRRDMEFK